MFKGNYLPSHKQRIRQLDANYHRLIDSHSFKPFAYPFGAFAIYLVLLYLLIDHRRRPFLRAIRWIVWLANAAYSVHLIANFRARGAVAAYGVGLGVWWGVLWTFTILIAHDAQDDFARIERPHRAVGAPAANGRPEADVHRGTGDGRELPCTAQPATSGDSAGLSSRDEDVVGEGSRNDLHVAWQAYPSKFTERLDWILDLLTNFRGMQWNWRIPNLPSPPKHIQEALRRSQSRQDTTLRRSQAPYQAPPKDVLLRQSIYKFCIGYLLLDFIRTLMIHDPYFRALGANYKPTYLPAVIRDSHILLQSYRLLIALFAVYWALATIFTLAPLFFVGLLGSRVLGVRGEPWMYPPEWGNYRTVLDRGLAGWWGEWWHQSFRFAFEAPSRRLTEWMAVDPRSPKGKALQLFIAFAISGSLHACASHTSIGETRPVRGPFTFFILQAVGISLQQLCSHLLRKARIEPPRVVRRVTNFIFTHVWLYNTAPLFIDDLAIGGQFLYEPVPFSIFRPAGLGRHDDSWFCWDGPWFRWHSAERWWESGLVT